MFGTGYIADYCMSRFLEDETRTQYNNYKTKSLLYIAEGICSIVNGLSNQEVMIPIWEYLEEKPKDTRAAEEVVDDVLSKCGLGG